VIFHFFPQYPAVLDLSWSYVDVRDVALCHVRAFENRNAHGRYLLASATRKMPEIISLIRNKFPNLSTPWFDWSGYWGTLAVWYLSYLYGKGERDYAHYFLGKHFEGSKKKAMKDLGVKWRDVDRSIEETYVDLMDKGYIAKPPAQ
jgi:dihydroflavonol-4-reductase